LSSCAKRSAVAGSREAAKKMDSATSPGGSRRMTVDFDRELLQTVGNT